MRSIALKLMSKIKRRLFIGQKGNNIINDRFLFDSGERQTGSKLQEIRHDHKVRYKLAIDYINNHDWHDKNIYGLDIFAGNGYGANMLAAGTGAYMLGIEGSGEAVSFADKYYSNNKTLFTNKIFPFQLPNCRYDFITCFESIEHVENDDELLSVIYNSLRPNGLLFISFPNQADMPLNKQMHPFHYRHYYHEQFMDSMKKYNNLGLLAWYGQNTYDLNNSELTVLDKISIMELTQNREGQFNLYIYTKH